MWLQLNQKNKPLKYLLKRARKNKSSFGISLQKHRGVLEGSIRSSSSTKDMGNRGKKYSTETTTQQLVEAVDFKVKINTKETFFDMLFPPIIPIEDLRNVHPWVKSLFSARIVTNLPLAGRLKDFLEAWEILTNDPEILEIVRGFKIPFLKNPTQKRVPQRRHTWVRNKQIYNTSGDREHVEEGSHTANRTSG